MDDLDVVVASPDDSSGDHAAPTGARRGPVGRWRFAAASLAALALATIVYLGLVGTVGGQQLENLALRGAELRSDADRSAGLARLAQVNLVALAGALVLFVAIGAVRGRFREGVAVAVIMGTSVVVVEILKEFLPRPALVSGPGWLLRNSFPSGTTAAAMAITIGAMLIAPDRLRWLIVAIGAVYVAFVSEAVQTTGWHRLSDTIGAALIVVGVACAGTALLAQLGALRRSEHGRIDRRISFLLLVAAAVTVVLAILVLAVASLFPLLTAPDGGRRVFLQTAFPLLGIGMVIGMVVSFAWLIEPFTLGRSDGAEPGSASSD